MKRTSSLSNVEGILFVGINPFKNVSQYLETACQP